MITSLIESQNYTSEIKSSIIKIKNRMKNTLIDFTDEDIKVFEHDDSIYILANPVLGEEPIFDDFGNFERMIPMYNLTIIYDEDWLKVNPNNTGLNLTVKIPRLRILRPDLCDKISVRK